MKKNKISKNWINKQRRDIYVRQSKVEGYRSRAVYKLKEINEKFKFLKNNISVIDLGAAPGSWSQYISSNLKCNKHLAIDLKEIEEIKNVKIIKGDFTDTEEQNKISNYFGGKIDLIIVDGPAKGKRAGLFEIIDNGDIVIDEDTEIIFDDCNREDDSSTATAISKKLGRKLFAGPDSTLVMTTEKRGKLND